MSLTPQQVYEYTLQQGDVIISPTYGPIPQPVPPTPHGTFWSTSASIPYPGAGSISANQTGILLPSAVGVELGSGSTGLKVPSGRWKFEVQVTTSNLAVTADHYCSLSVNGTNLPEFNRVRIGAGESFASWVQHANITTESNVYPFLGTGSSSPNGLLAWYVMTATKLD